MSAEPVELAQVGRYRYRHGWIMLDPRAATERRSLRKAETAEIAKAAARPPSGRKLSPEGLARMDQITAGLKAKTASRKAARTGSPPPSSPGRTRKLSGRDVSRLKEGTPTLTMSERAERATQRLTGRKASDYQHLAAARLHADAARHASVSKGRRQYHTRMAKMHKGIANRTPGRGTRSEARSASLATELAQHHPIDSSIPLGSGGRFAKMKAKLAARPGVRSPGRLAAFIGRRAYGRKKFGALSAAGRAAHAHSNTSPALELAMDRYPKLAVTSPYDVLITRGEDGTAVLRHRRGGYEIARIRRDPDGSWVAAVSGRDLNPHTQQRAALMEAIGVHNQSSGTPQHRPQPERQVVRAEPLQPPPVQTELMRAYGIPAIKALATPARGAADGPRVTTADGTPGLGARGHTIYKKLRSRGFPHERAHNFARRAQNKAGGS